MHPRVLIGGTLALGGLAMMAGWLFELKAVVRVFPGFLMVFNTAFGFACAGAALAAAALAPALRRAALTVAGCALVTLGALVLAQYIFGVNLGVDWPGLHSWMIDPGRNPFPGRMSPATSAGFMLSGVVFLLVPRASCAAQYLVVRGLTAAVGALGLAAVIGYVLNLPEILGAYWLKQVSLPTAVSFVLLSLGLWLGWRGEPWNAYRLIRNEDDRIALSGALVLAGCIVVAGTSGFWLLLSQMERTRTAELSLSLRDRQALVARSILRGVEQTAEVASRPNILHIYSEPSEDSDAADHAALLAAVARVMTRSDFTAFAFLDADGREIARAGEFFETSDLHISLSQASGAHRAALLWDGDFMLQARADILKDGVRLGEVRAQHRLKDLRAVMTSVADLGASSEFGLCGQRGRWLHCAPMRFQPRVFEVPQSIDGSALPMSHAIEGRTGVVKSIDYRGKPVLAAYTPLEGLGAGLVLKTDLSDLHAPVRDRLGAFVVTLLLATAAGGWLLRWRVRPLARRLMHSEVRLRLALENSKLAVWDWDVPSGQVSLSEQWAALLGALPRATEVSANQLFALVHPDDSAGVVEQVRSMLKGTTSHYSNEHRVRTCAGEWKWIRSRGRVVERARDGTALRAIGTNVDIDDRKGYELQLAHRAAHDVLTGLPNRGMFHDRLSRAMLRTRRSSELMAVLYLDVDKFKGVNDTLGHAAGDLLLKEFTRRLTACVRITDTVARFGGDEFAAIVEGLGGRADGLQIAGKIVEAMRAPFTLDGATASVSTSVGIAFHDGTAHSAAADLLEAADEALYDAKAGGRNRYCVAPDSRAAASCGSDELLAA
jgi:diguanylate cyclase (GGDEF)-like protein/PAS domain S-box-containing protein